MRRNLLCRAFLKFFQGRIDRIMTTKTPEPSGFLRRIYKFFTSVKLTVGLLLALAATSIVGTLIPQNKSLEDYYHAYGDVLFRIFYALNIFDMYHSWWFRFLMTALLLNIIICSVDRLSATWKIIFIKKPPFFENRFSKLPDKVTFSIDRPPDRLRPDFEAEIGRRYAYATAAPAETGYCLFGEKGRWTRLGVYIVHASVILLILGGMIGSIFGFEGYVNIPEGETADAVRLKVTGEPRKLGFGVRCDDFEVSFYETGAPREYRSTLTIIENGKPTLTRDIIVNDPLRYKGISLYQSSYGQVPRTERPAEISLSVTDAETGMIYAVTARMGEEIRLPAGAGALVLKEFVSAYRYMGQSDIGETFIGVLTPQEGDPREVILPVRFANFDKMRKGKTVISVTDYTSGGGAAGPRYFTGLQATRDPGVWVVYAGFVIMILGCVISFFMTHERICVKVTPKGGGSEIMVSGTVNKNKISMERRISKLSEALLKRGRKHPDA